MRKPCEMQQLDSTERESGAFAERQSHDVSCTTPTLIKQCDGAQEVAQFSVKHTFILMYTLGDKLDAGNHVSCNT